jgi:hypothetical protein
MKRERIDRLETGQVLENRPRCFICTWQNPMQGHYELLTEDEANDLRRRGLIVTESRL